MDMNTGTVARGLLVNFDYNKALQFVSEYGSKSAADLLQKMSRSSFSEKKLLAELERLAEESGRLHGLSACSPHGAEKAPLRATASIPIAAATNSTRSQLLEERNNIVREIDHYRGQLEYIETDEDRLTTALHILDLEESLNNKWNDIRYFDEHGDLPVQFPKDDLEAVFFGVSNYKELIKIRNNYRTYISRANKQGKFLAKLSFYEAVLAEAERRLDQ